MSKYRVEFEFRVIDPEISDGKWHKEYLDNNGEGMTFEEAERVACDVRENEFYDTKNVDVVEIEGVI